MLMVRCSCLVKSPRVVTTRLMACVRDVTSVNWLHRHFRKFRQSVVANTVTGCAYFRSVRTSWL